MTRNRYYNEEPSDNVAQDMPTGAAKIEFANRLRRAMDDKGWTQAELGRRAGIPRDSVSVYIAGKSLPGPARLKKLAQALGKSSEDLLPTRGVRSAGDRLPALDARDLGDDHVWLRVNQRVAWPAALKIMGILKGEDK